MSDSATSWTVACQAPLSMEFSRWEYWIGYHSLLQGIFLTQDQTQISCIAGRFFTIWATREALIYEKGGPKLKYYSYDMLDFVDIPH